MLARISFQEAVRRSCISRMGSTHHSLFRNTCIHIPYDYHDRYGIYGGLKVGTLQLKFYPHGRFNRPLLPHHWRRRSACYHRSMGVHNLGPLRVCRTDIPLRRSSCNPRRRRSSLKGICIKSWYQKEKNRGVGPSVRCFFRELWMQRTRFPRFRELHGGRPRVCFRSLSRRHLRRNRL